MPNTFGYSFKGGNRSFVLPNKCPQCHHTVVITGTQVVNASDHQVEAVILCPNDECHRLFIAYYEIHNNTTKLVKLKPAQAEFDIKSPQVLQISPIFVVTYLQALQARSLDLAQIAGPGFRKAFEFLIKDYAKTKTKPEEHKDIEQSFAGAVIKKYIKDSRIEKVAKRALWLGNDETHYLRKWEDHDIDDLIMIIKLTVNWIEIETLSEKYSTELPDSAGT